MTFPHYSGTHQINPQNHWVRRKDQSSRRRSLPGHLTFHVRGGLQPIWHRCAHGEGYFSGGTAPREQLRIKKPGSKSRTFPSLFRSLAFFMACKRLGLPPYPPKPHLSPFPLFRVKGKKQLDIFRQSCKVGRKEPKSKSITEFTLFTVNDIAFPVAA